MRIRKALFWTHLAIGIAAGLVILMLSVTGILLASERQILELDERRFDVPAQADQAPISIDELHAIGKQKTPDIDHFEFKIVNRPGAPYTIVSNDWDVWLVNPYTGAILREGDGGVATFFHVVTDLHRWFAAEGESRPIWRAVTGYSNLAFLALLLTGVYLWLPRAWHWAILRNQVFFNPRATNPKARDFNWHHVFSFWALVPLFLIITSGVVISFPWADRAVYAFYGEDHAEHDDDHEPPVTEPAPEHLSHQAMLDIAVQHAREHGADDWHSIWMDASESPGDAATFYIDRSLGHRLDFGYDLTLDGSNGEVIEYMQITDYSDGDQARWYLRFLHTGDAYGFVGQTVAMLASLAACLLVYTGLALAWRRLVSPLLRRRRQSG